MLACFAVAELRHLGSEGREAAGLEGTVGEIGEAGVPVATETWATTLQWTEAGSGERYQTNSMINIYFQIACLAINTDMKRSALMKRRVPIKLFVVSYIKKAKFETQ